MLKFVVVSLLSHVRIFCNLWTVAHQAPLSMGFPRQEYWSGLLFPSLGGSPPPRNQTSIFCVTGRFFITKPPVKSNIEILSSYKYIGFFFCLFQVEEALEAVKNATNEQDLANRFKEFGKEMVKLNYVAARRQQVGKILEI